MKNETHSQRVNPKPIQVLNEQFFMARVIASLQNEFIIVPPETIPNDAKQAKQTITALSQVETPCTALDYADYIDYAQLQDISQIGVARSYETYRSILQHKRSLLRSPKNFRAFVLTKIITDVIGNELLKKEEITAACQSDESMIAKIHEHIRNRPNISLQHAPALSIILSAAELRHICDSWGIEADAEHFLKFFVFLKQLYSAAEKKTVLQRAFTAHQHQFLVAEFLRYPSIVENFTLAEQRALARKYVPISLVMSSLDMEKVIDRLVTTEVLTEPEVRELALTNIGNRFSIYLAAKLQKYFKTEEDKARLRESVFTSFMRDTDGQSIEQLSYVINSSNPLLSKLQLRQIIEKRISSNKRQLIKDVRLLLLVLGKKETIRFIQSEIANPQSAIYTEPSSFFFPEGIAWKLFATEFSEADHRKLVDIICAVHPELGLEYIDNIFQLFPDTDKKNLALSLLENSGLFRVLNHFETWFKYFEDADIPVIKQLIAEKLYGTDPDSLSFVDYMSEPSKMPKRNAAVEQFLLDHFGKDELDQLLVTKLYSGEYNHKMKYDFKGVCDTLQNNPQALRQLLAWFAQNDVSVILDNIGEFIQLQTGLSIEDLLLQNLKNDKHIQIILLSTHEWANRVEADFTNKFLQACCLLHPAIVIQYTRRILFAIPLEKRDNFTRTLAQSNPAACMQHVSQGEELFDPGLHFEEILQIGMDDNTTRAIAPRSLEKFYKSFKKLTAKKQLTDRSIQFLLKNAAFVYSQIAFIRFNGLAEAANKLTANYSTAKEEQSVLALLQCCVLLEISLTSLPDSIQELERRVYSHICEMLDVQNPITEQAISRFTTAIPMSIFVKYLSYHYHSVPHKQLLRTLIIVLSTGGFLDYKFGTFNDFDSLKATQLLPTRLTYSQYRVWQEDSESTADTHLAASAEDVIMQIKRIIQNENKPHLHIPELWLNKPQDGIYEVTQQLTTIGTQIADLHRLNSPSESEKLTLENLIRKRNTCTVQAALLSLLLLSPTEVSSGYIMKNLEKSKVDKITTILEKAKSSALPDVEPVLSAIQQILISYYNSGVQHMHIAIRDTSNPTALFQVGSEPVRTCQDWSSGSYNECLIATVVDPNTKVSQVVDSISGEVIGRRIIRLLSDSHGNPSIFCDTLYTSTAAVILDELLLSHMVEKAERMNVPLYISAISKRSKPITGPTKKKIRLGSLVLSMVSDSISATKSRAPYVYLDEYGGKIKDGKYTIQNIYLVRKVHRSKSSKK